MRLLLVEDDQTLARRLQKGLLERAFAVDVTDTARQATYLAAINDYDAILLDVGLPEGDGFAVCQEVRERNPVVRILMLTARDTLADRVFGLDAGADDYLTKPFAFEELLARLRALLRRRGEVSAPVITVGDLEIDTACQVVSRAGRAIPLSTKEYALLETLALNQGRVMGRAEISQHVWDDNYDPASNLIEVYISRLRQKIDQDGAKLIHTRRGAGYLVGELDPDTWT